MIKTTLHYKVLITPDRQTGTEKPGFTAYVPKLGIADDGYTVEEALKNVRLLIKFHLESLISENDPIPSPDPDDSLITTASVELPAKIKLIP